MERILTKDIKDSKIRTYFEEITDGRTHSVELSAEELEKGMNMFISGMDKALVMFEGMKERANIRKKEGRKSVSELVS